MVTIAIREGKLDKAKEIGEKFPNDPIIQSQMVTIAIREGNTEKSQEIEEKMTILEMQEDVKEVIEKSMMSDGNEGKYILNRLKTQLYYDKIDKEIISEVEASKELNDFEKLISMLAICEKRNMTERAKSLSKNYTPKDKKEKSIINDIMNRTQSKRQRIFDFVKYDSILHWSFDKDLKAKYEEELRKEKEDKKQRTVEVSKNKKVTKSVKQPVSKKEGQSEIEKKKLEKKVKDRKTTYRESIAVKQPIRVDSNQRQESKINLEEETTINKDKTSRNKIKNMVEYINKFVKDQRVIVYINAQSHDPKIQADAISKWDRIEILLERIAERSEDYEYIENLYNKIISLTNRKGIER